MRNEKHPIIVISAPLPKLCRHRRRMSSGRCIDCGMHRDPMTVGSVVITGHTAPSAALAVRI